MLVDVILEKGKTPTASFYSVSLMTSKQKGVTLKGGFFWGSTSTKNNEKRDLDLVEDINSNTTGLYIDDVTFSQANVNPLSTCALLVCVM